MANKRLNQHTIITRMIKAGYELVMINGRQVLRKAF